MLFQKPSYYLLAKKILDTSALKMLTAAQSYPSVASKMSGEWTLDLSYFLSSVDDTVYNSCLCPKENQLSPLIYV